MPKEAQARVLFWGTAQLMMLVVWVICLILGERFYFTPPLLHFVEGAGMLLIASGLALAFLGGYELGDQLTTTPDPDDVEEHEFITTGIYDKVRHPIYGGTLLAIAGLTLIYASATAVLMVIVMAALFYAQTLSDEVRMLRRFPDYLPYATRTRRFVPFIW